MYDFYSTEPNRTPPGNLKIVYRGRGRVWVVPAVSALEGFHWICTQTHTVYMSVCIAYVYKLILATSFLSMAVYVIASSRHLLQVINNFCNVGLWTACELQYLAPLSTRATLCCVGWGLNGSRYQFVTQGNEHQPAGSRWGRIHKVPFNLSYDYSQSCTVNIKLPKFACSIDIQTLLRVRKI